MKTGLYEQIVNTYLSNRLDKIDNNHKLLCELNDSDSNDYLSQYLFRVLSQGLSEVKGTENGLSKIEKQIDICNEIINVLNSRGIDTDQLEVSQPAKKLMEIMDETINYKNIRPDTPLALGALLTGTRLDPSLESQLKKEILSCDNINILCSFIKWSGIRLLKEELKQFTEIPGHELRIITTSYMGVTDVEAIEFLEALPNTTVKVSYDNRRTRLHAKSYLFERKTGFSSAYVGSSNISNAALTDGLEWNIKISQYEQPFQWEKIKATFDTYWNDTEFESYSSKDKSRLIQSLKQAENNSKDTDDFVMPNFNLSPYPFQKEILEAICAERELQNRSKHLIIAATGTGKTMIAAFDFKDFRKQFKEKNGYEPKLMFVAQREEILKQSLSTFRGVLLDPNFGDIMVGGNTPEQIDQIFISIQTYNSKQMYNLTKSDYYDYIVVDEFHHAAAPSYKKMLEYIKPESLLGLTATPERTDNLDIMHYFDNHITAEIRLPDAIDRKLLSPFQYFGVTDSVDYSDLKWQRGGYLTNELTNIYTANDIRVKMICKKTIETVLDIKKVRGLGFCVSKEHAKYMATKFNEYNIPSAFLTADSDKETRNSVRKKLVDLEINFIFVVDLYNEGVDIPEVDTVLFLRPTESLTVFLQQLGRGLRLSKDKDCLCVLDFIGQANKNYRFDLKFNSLIENVGKNIDDEVDQGFPHLPAGCSIILERKSKEFILNNIRQTLNLRKNTIINKVSTFTADTGENLTFERFIDYYKLKLDDIYSKCCWSRVLVEAGITLDFNDVDEEKLRKGIRRLFHIDDIKYIDCILKFMVKDYLDLVNISQIEKQYLIMFILSIWNKEKFSSIEEGFLKLKNNKTIFKEIIMLLKYKRNLIKNISPSANLPYPSSLSLHCRYTQAEALTGLGYFDLQNNHNLQSGVLHIKDKNTDVFFITLNKNEKDYSPTTMYKDYAINDHLFHWQTQASTRIDSTTGQRYINHRKNNHTILLFVRDARNKNGLAEPYYFLGSAKYISHKGERPINFVWELESSMPAHLTRQTTRLVVG